jgi:hypothetical protein
MASTFECNGCGHHASFHNIENPHDDAVIKRWHEAEKRQAQALEESVGFRKRPRKVIENGPSSQAVRQVSGLMGGSGSGGRTIKQATEAGSGRQQRRVPAVIDELERIVDISGE